MRVYTQEEVEASAGAQNNRCLVLLGAKVCDITDFAPDHPGGSDIVWEHAGQDVAGPMASADGHFHSAAAFDILEDFQVGVLAGRASSGGVASDRPILDLEKNLHKETDPAEDLRQHRFLDLDRPLLAQVWSGGFDKHFYLDQVHRPRHCRGGRSALIFGGLLEPFTKTPWWVIPALWLPSVGYGLVRALDGLSPAELAGWFGLGLAMWTLIEYGMHRFLFHLDDYLPNNRVALTGHFLIHGIHHYLPMDQYRLVLPPALFLFLATPFWRLAHAMFWFSWYAATAVFCGQVFGYVCYEMTHYFLHHRSLPMYYQNLKKHHLEHHFTNSETGFGVSSTFWDHVFGTNRAEAAPKK